MFALSKPLRSFLLLLSCLSWCFCYTVPSSSFLSRSASRGSLTRLRYGSESKGSNDNSFSWEAVTSTEKWLTDIIPDNMTRKTVSYVCEPAKDTATLVSSIWSRLSLSRKSGEEYMSLVASAKLGPNERVKPYRSTLVIVCPGCEEVEEFRVFDEIIQRINESRSHARNFVVESVADKMKEAIDEEISPPKVGTDWSMSVNMAHLHPSFDSGAFTRGVSQEKIDAEREAEREYESKLSPEEMEVRNENKRKIEIYKERKVKARRSPHPTVIIEVRGAPVDAGADETRNIMSRDQRQKGQMPPGRPGGASADGGPPASSSPTDIKKLEASFMRAAAANAKAGEEAQGEAKEGVGKDLSDIARQTLNPNIKVREWLGKVKPNVVSSDIKLKDFDGKYADEAYSFIFSAYTAEVEKASLANRRPRLLVLSMTRFLQSSATSFSKFAFDLQRIADMTNMASVDVERYHPEDVDVNKRAPTAIIVLRRREEEEEDGADEH